MRGKTIPPDVTLRGCTVFHSSLPRTDERDRKTNWDSMNCKVKFGTAKTALSRRVLLTPLMDIRNMQLIDRQRAWILLPWKRLIETMTRQSRLVVDSRKAVPPTYFRLTNDERELHALSQGSLAGKRGFLEANRGVFLPQLTVATSTSIV